MWKILSLVFRLEPRFFFAGLFSMSEIAYSRFTCLCTRYSMQCTGSACSNIWKEFRSKVYTRVRWIIISMFLFTNERKLVSFGDVDDLVPYIFISHRHRILISIDGKAVLSALIPTYRRAFHHVIVIESLLTHSSSLLYLLSRKRVSLHVDRYTIRATILRIARKSLDDADSPRETVPRLLVSVSLDTPCIFVHVWPRVKSLTAE